MENIFEAAFENFQKDMREHGRCAEFPLVFSKAEFDLFKAHFYTLLDEVLPQPLQELLPLMVAQVQKGDKKYGPHPGPKRAFGALRNEYNELQTELEAEDANPESIFLENIQVWAMAYKMLRDYTLPAINEQTKMIEDLRTSAQWMTDTVGGLKIISPDGWDKENIHQSFYVEKITLLEFLGRLKNSNYQANAQWMTNYGNLMEKMPQ